MKKETKILAVMAVLMAVTVLGCNQKTTNSSDAIAQSQSKGSVEEQVNYLVGQANSFIKSEKYDEAVETAKYILSNLDSNSTEAKGIIEKAKEELKKIATEKINEATGDMKDKLGNFGN